MKTKPINLKRITVSNLEKDKFINELPEIYRLKNNLENNPWHKNQSTFNHTILVLKALKKNIRKYKNLQKYLKQIVNKHSRQNILFLATIFHDIAKPETKTITKEGWTMFPNHEDKSATKTMKILQKCDITRKEICRMGNIIKHHDALHLFLNGTRADRDLEKLQKEFKDIYLELLLLSKSDTEGSNLRDLNSQDFKRRVSFFEKELMKFKI